MTTGASRIAAPLGKLVCAFARTDLPAAEIWRRVGSAAERRGLARPSYECIRQLVRAERLRHALAGPSLAEVYLDVSTRVRPMQDLFDHIAGFPVAPRDGA